MSKVKSAVRLGTFTPKMGFQSCQWRSFDISLDLNYYKEVMVCPK